MKPSPSTPRPVELTPDGFVRCKKFFLENVRRLIAEKNLSLKQLSRLTRMARSALRKILTGESDPKLDTIYRLAHVLGVCASELFRPPQVALAKAVGPGTRRRR